MGGEEIKPENGNRGKQIKDWDNCSFLQLSQLFLLLLMCLAFESSFTRYPVLQSSPWPEKNTVEVFGGLTTLFESGLNGCLTLQSPVCNQALEKEISDQPQVHVANINKYAG